MPRKSKKPPAIGLSMLDLISNALAASIILFVIISSLQTPVIPPERMKGTVFIKCTFDNQNIKRAAQVWLTHKRMPDNNDNREIEQPLYFDEEIFLLNLGGENKVFDSDKINDGDTLATAIHYYTNKEKFPNEFYIIMRDPPEGKWEVGILYTDDEDIYNNQNPVQARIEIDYLMNNLQDKHTDTTKLLVSTTDYLNFTFPLKTD